MLEIRVLGPVEVVRGGERLPLGGARQRGVLTLLVLSAGAAVPTERLIDRLWSGEPPPSATVTLQGYVARLRRVFQGPDGAAIETRGAGYALVVEPDTIDARRFERLLAEGQGALDAGRAEDAHRLGDEALALWRGPALADLLDEPYAAAEAARLEELRLAALELRAEAALALGRHPSVVAELEALVAEHPLREGLRGQLMRALHGSGRTAEALRTYAAGREVLVEELGIEPGAALRRLERAILEQDPAVEPPPAPTPTPLPPAAGNGAAPAPLPVPLTSFVGREREVRDVRAALERERLVTLLGPGGTGKTRLSLEVATALCEAGEDVALVELAGLVDAALVPAAVATALGVHDEPDRTLVESLVDALRPRSVHLVLDNCEHVLAAAAALAATLLRGCAGLRVLATSRAPLGVPGEVAWPLPALPVPASDDVDLDTALAAEGVQLFVERARAAAPGLRLTDADAPLLVSVCRRLDGMPLALELAAARLRVLSLAQVADRLDDRFRLLTGGSTTLEPRQRTLRAAVDWSYDLLGEAERLVFQRLSVFPGSFGLDAAEAVCADGTVDALDVLDLLGDLVSKSLVTRLPDGDGEARFRLLESLRDYAAARLAAGPDEAAVLARHADLVVRRVEDAADRLEGPERRRGLERLLGLADDARLALDTALDRRDVDAALRMVGALWRLWDQRYDVTEGRTWLTRALALPGGPPGVRAEALLGAAKLAFVDDDHDGALAACDEGLALAASAADDRRRARLLTVRAEVLRERGGGLTAAEGCADEALALTEAAGDRWWQANATRVRALLALDRGELGRTTTLAMSCLELTSAVGDLEGSAGARFMLSGLARRAGDVDRAVELCEGSLADFRQASDPWGTAQAVHALGSLAVLRGDAELGRRLGEESLRLHDELGNARGVALSYQLLGEAALEDGDLQGADVLLGEALDRFRERGFALDCAEADWRVGEVALRRGDLARALRLARSGLEPYRNGQRRGAVQGLCLLALVQARRGDAPAALGSAEEALALAAEAGDDLGSARALDAVAEAALAAGDPQRAARALSAAAMTRRVAGAHLSRREEADERQLVEAVRTHLGDTPFARQWAAEWPPEVIDLREPAPDPTPDPAQDRRR